MIVKYKVFNPSGNITALVLGNNYSKSERIIINNKIMNENKMIEQVGFVSLESRELLMAGGEFCGNATRCACKYYLEETGEKEVSVKINDYLIRGGKYSNGDIWCENPIPNDNNLIEILSENITKVNLSGITLLVVPKEEKELKMQAIQYMKKYKLNNELAVGVIFQDYYNNNLRIYPVIWVRDVDTIFLENACGSGSIATAIVKNMITHENKFNILQPSGEFLNIEILDICEIRKVILSGKIVTDNIVKKIII